MDGGPPLAGVTVHSVAQRAGVSISTVSRVLTGSAPVSEELRRRVLRAVRELGYYPNALARGLRMNRTGIIGLMVPDISNPFFGELAMAVEVTASKARYGILLCNSQNSRERERQYLELLQAQRVDGLLVVGSKDIELDLEQFLQTTGAAVVSLDRKIPGFSGPWVGADPSPGVFQAVQHLAELGHRRLGVVRGPSAEASSEERYESIRQAVVQYGVEIPAECIWEGEYTLESGQRAGEAIARLPASSRPTAVIATSELSAFGLVRAAARAGLRVPSQLSVVSFDDTLFAEIHRPPLTAIAQPTREIGEQGTRLLLQMMDRSAERSQEAVAPPAGSLLSRRRKRAAPRAAALPTRLIVRESTARPAVSG